jgi:PhzF family phenazine biosynthesis protein
MKIYLVDAFTSNRFEGNRAGVVFDVGSLTRERKQQIAAEINASETAFVHELAPRRFKIEFFTPTTEIDFCGHATVALSHTLANTSRVQLESGHVDLSIETKAGVFPIRVSKSADSFLVTMKGTSGQWAPLKASRKDIAEALQIEESALSPNYPIMFAKVANWHLFVAVRSEEVLSSINYDAQKLSAILAEKGAVTAHIFSEGSEDVFHARNFGPSIGIPEDPATGSAATAFGAYLVENALSPRAQHEFVILQGEKMGRPSRLEVRVLSEGKTLRQVEVTGTAVLSFELAEP